MPVKGAPIQRMVRDAQAGHGLEERLNKNFAIALATVLGRGLRVVTVQN